MAEKGKQFNSVSAGEAHAMLTAMHGSEYTGVLDDKKSTKARPTGALIDSMTTSPEPTTVREKDKERTRDVIPTEKTTTTNRRGPKASADPRRADKEDLRDIGAAMGRGDWEPAYNSYGASFTLPEKGRRKKTHTETEAIEAGLSPTGGHVVNPATGKNRVARNQFGGMSMRTVAGNPALRRQIRLGMGSETGDTNPFDVLDEELTRKGVQEDKWHTPKSQAKVQEQTTTKTTPGKTIFDHVQDHGVTTPIEVDKEGKVPNPVHRAIVAAANFHDPKQSIQFKHI